MHATQNTNERSEWTFSSSINWHYIGARTRRIGKAVCVSTINVPVHIIIRNAAQCSPMHAAGDTTYSKSKDFWIHHTNMDKVMGTSSSILWIQSLRNLLAGASPHKEKKISVSVLFFVGIAPVTGRPSATARSAQLRELIRLAPRPTRNK